MAPKASGEIVGREAELETAGAFIESVLDGPAALFIEGEAGIGKTSVWSRCLNDARARGFHVLESRAAEAETGLGYTTLVDLLAGVENNVLEELPLPQRRALEIALLRAETAKGRADPRAVSTATLGVLRSLAKTTPLLLAIDDLQWVDSASDRVIRFVLRRLEDERIGCVATRRVERDDSATTFDRTLAASRVHPLRLEPLSLDEIEAVVLGFGDRLARPTLERLYTISGGTRSLRSRSHELFNAVIRAGRPRPRLPFPTACTLSFATGSTRSAPRRSGRSSPRRPCRARRSTTSCRRLADAADCARWSARQTLRWSSWTAGRLCSRIHCSHRRSMRRGRRRRGDACTVRCQRS